MVTSDLTRSFKLGIKSKLEAESCLGVAPVRRGEWGSQITLCCRGLWAPGAIPEPTAFSGRDTLRY